jgi:hypothetical protein
MEAEALSRKLGRVAPAPSAPSSGEFGEAKVIRKFGDVPDDLSEL